MEKLETAIEVTVLPDQLEVCLCNERYQLSGLLCESALTPVGSSDQLSGYHPAIPCFRFQSDHIHYATYFVRYSRDCEENPYLGDMIFTQDLSPFILVDLKMDWVRGE